AEIHGSRSAGTDGPLRAQWPRLRVHRGRAAGQVLRYRAGGRRLARTGAERRRGDRARRAGESGDRRGPRRKRGLTAQVRAAPGVNRGALRRATIMKVICAASLVIPAVIAQSPSFWKG